MSVLRSATIYPLQIPFVEAFTHHNAPRRCCDSVVVKVIDDAGIEGFGEGVPRPYVTGETPAFMVDHLSRTLVPSVLGRDLPVLRERDDLARLAALMDQRQPTTVRSDNACRAALELAMIDCVLRRQGMAVADLFAIRGHRVVYSGVIGAGSSEKALAQARQMKWIGLQQIKIKVGFADDVPRVRAIREIFGPAASIRVDANGAWTLCEAVKTLHALSHYDIAAVEEPLAERSVADLVRLRQSTPIPVIVDESVVTAGDADELIERHAVDMFNIRVSKCGGLSRSMAIAQRARSAGVGVQIGAHVGETAILSAAGRVLAAALAEVPRSGPGAARPFVEGSYGTLLLAQDVGDEEVRFGRGGESRVLGGPGLGISVSESVLRTYGAAAIQVQPNRGGR